MEIILKYAKEIKQRSKENDVEPWSKWNHDDGAKEGFIRLLLANKSSLSCNIKISIGFSE